MQEHIRSYRTNVDKYWRSSTASVTYRSQQINWEVHDVQMFELNKLGPNTFITGPYRYREVEEKKKHIDNFQVVTAPPSNITIKQQDNLTTTKATTISM